MQRLEQKKAQAKLKGKDWKGKSKGNDSKGSKGHAGVESKGKGEAATIVARKGI